MDVDEVDLISRVDEKLEDRDGTVVREGLLPLRSK